MEQVSQYVAGERDYTKIEGGTGPLVYPAAHVYIYTGLYHLTNQGKDIFLAQQMFAVLYLATLAVVMLCYWQAKVRIGRAFGWRIMELTLDSRQVPPYIFPLLILSKRLHSIFILRCFNDCFAAFFFWLSIYLFQRRSWTLGALAYSWGLGIKMSLLLVLPAVAVVLFLGRGFWGSLRLAALMAQVQVAIAIPFISANWQGYVGRAFELSRQFKFEWTVNWRMVGEEMFLSSGFSNTLLLLHAVMLSVFISTKWLRPADRSLNEMLLDMVRLKPPFSPEEERRISNRLTPRYVMTTILGANIVGLLFARSLHYQFYAYLAWTTPYLLWRVSPIPGLEYAVVLLQEWAWNVFPSTDSSSRMVVNILLLTAFVTYFDGSDSQTEMGKEKEKEKKNDAPEATSVVGDGTKSS